MALDRPYKRIARPFVDGGYVDSTEHSYISDQRYAADRIDLVRGYHLLEKDLFRIFEYVEPADANAGCYSHHLYALLLRASTEFEANAKAILRANAYAKSSLNIVDYHKLNAAMRLSEYEVTVPVWKGAYRRFAPLSEWQTGHSLTWYQGYNDAKHNRASEFHQASLRHAVHAVGAVFAILFAQFHAYAFDPHHTVALIQTEENDEVWTHEAALLGLRPPSSWSAGEKYAFSWMQLRSEASPLAHYPF